MKILIITARYFPEQFSITNIAEELHKNGNDVTVITGRPHYGYGAIFEGFENVKEQTINGVRIFRIKEAIRKKGVISLAKNYLSIFFQYKKFLRKHKEKYDVVLSHVMSPIFTLRGANYFAKREKIPHVHYGLDLWPESLTATYYFRKESLFFKIMKNYSRRLYSNCDSIAFSSPSAEEYFHNYLNLPNIEFKHIYQPCLTSPPHIDEIKKHSFRKNGKLRILYCGTIGRFHRLDLMIDAIAKIEKKEEIEFHIVGSGSELENIKNLVAKRDLSNVVTFFGRIPVADTIKHYLEADILFLPLINNSKTSFLIPQKAIEYLMYGKPILGMLDGDGAEIIKKSSALNVVANYQNADCLADSIKEMLSFSLEKLEKCGNENRDFFDREKRFKLENVVHEITDLLVDTKKK